MTQSLKEKTGMFVDISDDVNVNNDPSDEWTFGVERLKIGSNEHI